MSDSQQNSASFEAYVDRIEANLAVIVIGGEDSVQFDLPLHQLPPDTKAGDHLTISIHPAPERTEATLRSVTALQQDLQQTPDEGATEFKL